MYANSDYFIDNKRGFECHMASALKKSGGKREGAGRKGVSKEDPDRGNLMAVNMRARVAMNKAFLDESTSALNTLTSVMVNTLAENKDRIAAAREVLDRGMGKIIQTHELSGPNGQPIQHQTQVADLSSLKTADLKQLETLLAQTVLASNDRESDIIDVTPQ